MSVMFEVYYKAPLDEVRHATIAKALIPFGARLTYREESKSTVCLTFEFAERASAERASAQLRKMGEHVEQLQDY